MICDGSAAQQSPFTTAVSSGPAGRYHVS